MYKLATEANYADYKHIIADNDLILLHTDSRWQELLKTIKATKDKIEEKYNRKLISLIDSIEMEDQKWRGLLRQFLNNEIDTTLYPQKMIHTNITKTDSLNYYLCSKIINQYGYPTYEIAGVEAIHNFWLVLQHQDRHVLFQDSVLKLMKRELDKNQVSGADYAYLTDRVKINMKEPQIYGTQMELNKDKTSYKSLPLVEPEKVNERRKSVGLGTEEDYIKTMNNRYFGTLKK